MTTMPPAVPAPRSTDDLARAFRVYVGEFGPSDLRDPAVATDFALWLDTEWETPALAEAVRIVLHLAAATEVSTDAAADMLMDDWAAGGRIADLLDADGIDALFHIFHPGSPR